MADRVRGRFFGKKRRRAAIGAGDIMSKSKDKNKDKEKTNVMRVLDSLKIEYVGHTYEPDPTRSGEEIAAILGIPQGTVKYHLSMGRTHLKQHIQL
jgi:hypothetical protein